MLEIDNWKYKFGAILGCSQMLEYMTEQEEIKKYFHMIHNATDFNNPMLVLACSHALGLFVEFVDFRELGLEDPLWEFILKFVNNPVSVTRTSGQYILMNFFDKTFKNKQELFPFLIQKLQIAVEHQNQLEIAAVLPNVYELLAEFNQLMITKYTEMVDLCFNLGNSFRNKQMPLVISEVLCFLGKLTKVSDPTLFDQYYDKIMTFFCSLIQELTPQDILLMFPNGFQCIRFLKFDDIKTHYFDQILLFCLKVFQIIYQETNLNNPELISEKTECQNLFQIFSGINKRILGPRLKEIFQMYLIFMNAELEVFKTDLTDELDFFSYLATSLKFMTISNSEENKQVIGFDKHKDKININININDKRNIILNLIGFLENILLNNTQYKVLSDVGDALVEILKYGGDCLRKEDFSFLVDRCFRFMDKYNFMFENPDDINHKQITFINEETSMDDFKTKIKSFLVSLAECFGMILKYYKSEEVLIIATNKFRLRETSEDPQINKAKLFLICDILEHSSDLLQSKTLLFFMDILKKYINHANDSLVNAAVFGVGLGVMKLDPSIIVDQINEYWHILQNHSYVTERQINFQKQFALDNIVAALGKFLLKLQKIYNSQTLFKVPGSHLISDVNAFKQDLVTKTSFWISLLPVKRDLVEYKNTIDIMLQLMSFVNINEFMDNTLFQFLNFFVISRCKLEHLCEKYVINHQDIGNYTRQIDEIVSRLMSNERVKGVIANHYWDPKHLNYLKSVKITIDVGDSFSNLIQQL
jgi:VanZ family protein